ncbi:MAG: purine-binding chemotaxis protein CheW [SAR324 cluster bacterium]|nr:purine-binding chemotaxis protein CheW [SAR324 cluster bacterium]
MTSDINEELAQWNLLDNYEDIDLDLHYGEEGTQVLVFSLMNETYGIDILKVMEIINFTRITQIPNVPSFICGVINLRGVIVPVVDLGKKFGFPERPYTKYTIIIVVQVGQKLMGVIVDAVSDVTFLSSANIQPPPAFSETIDVRFLQGMAQIKDNLMILIDIEGIMSEEELGLISL